MSDPNAGPNKEPLSPLDHLTLDPIAKFSTAALAPDPAQAITKVRLIKYGLQFNNATRDTLTRETDETIFPEGPSTETLDLPVGAKMTQATLKIDFADTQPITLDLHPPFEARLEKPANVRRIAAWLFGKKFFLSLGGALAHLTYGLLVIATALAASCTTPDADDDDWQDDKHPSARLQT